jgi:hypothetical protein
MSEYFLSQIKLNANIKDLIFYLYQVPVSDFQFEKMERESYQIVKELRKLNPGQLIHFKGFMIGSPKPIERWPEEVKIPKPQVRSIDLSNVEERRLLERLILKNIQDSQPQESFFSWSDYGEILECDPYIKDGIEMFRGVKLDVNVDHLGQIFVGFDLIHRFRYRKNLYQLLNSSADGQVVEQGTEVVDTTVYPHRYYYFHQKSQKVVTDPILYNNSVSLIEYHKGLGKKVDSIPRDTYVVEVKGKKGEKPIYHIPQFLRLVCTLESTKGKFDSKIKMSPKEKIRSLAEVTKAVFNNWRRDNTLKIDFNLRDIDPRKQGFEVATFSYPSLRFGKNVVEQKIILGLENGGVYEQVDQPVTFKYLVQPDIRKHLIERNDQNKEVFKFGKILMEQSRKYNVVLRPIKSDYSSLDFNDQTKLRLGVKKIINDLEQLTIVIISDEPKYAYEVIKQEISGYYDLSSQVIKLGTIHNKANEQYIVTNLLLGIYAKAGIQPWVLAKPLHSDCYIGLDKSRENDKTASGIVQVVGKDGSIVWSSPLSSHERGERIHTETLNKAITETLYRLQEKPKHITIHRDGKEIQREIDDLKEILAPLDISFDYVSVIKSANRRMAVKDSKTNEWITKRGLAFINEQKKIAYLCSTDSNQRVGMAQPIKIVLSHGSTPLKKIVQDIYHLSYMNIHCTNKSRLPVTTNYADKSATFFNRSMLTSNKKTKSLGFV